MLTFLPDVDVSSSTCDCRGLSMTLLVLAPLPGAVSLKACAWIRDCFGTCTVKKCTARSTLSIYRKAIVYTKGYRGSMRHKANCYWSPTAAQQGRQRTCLQW